MLEIIYQDQHLVAINKPSGLLVHKSDVDKYETQNAMQLLRDQLGQWVYPTHRIDKPTSGVLLFALNSDTARQVTQAFTDKQIKKTYLALVRGYTLEQDTIDYPLKVRYDKKTDRKARANKPPQDAVTHYQRLAQVEVPFAVGRYESSRYSLIQAKPETGRNRQIRRHLKHIFHPIVGDTAHGDGKHNELFRNEFNSHRLLLHARQLTMEHPLTGEHLTLQAPLTEDFSEVLSRIGIEKGSF